MLAPSSAAMPRPETLSSGSTLAITTCPIPALMSALVQGGVRPVCAHGSRLTNAVDEFASSPARSSATISACYWPAAECQPSPTICPSLTITQPTRGFGVVLKTVAASSIDLCICEGQSAKDPMSCCDVRIFILRNLDQL